MKDSVIPSAASSAQQEYSRSVIFIVCLTAGLANVNVRADQNWDGDNPIGNFSNNDNWYSNTVGGPSAFGFGNGSLHFSYRNNPSQTSLYYDLGWQDTNDIVWDNTFGAGLTLDGSGNGLNFNQRLENNSAFTQVVGITMNLSGAKNGATHIELNPANGNLTLNGSLFNDNSKPYEVWGNNGKTLTVNTNLGVGSSASSVSFTIKQNSHVIFNAAQDYAGATTISGGKLEAAVEGALTNTSSITVNAGGTLLLSGSGNRISDTAPFTLAGGTLDTGGLSETLGALTLTADSVINLGSGASILTFADSSASSWGSFRLSIYNWSGTTFTGGGTDQLRFTGNGLTTAQLGQIDFFSGTTLDSKISITGAFPANAFVGGMGEVAPVPEPSTVMAAIGLLGLTGLGARLRHRASPASSIAGVAAR
jgi:autotransporter-associated beta strand protein